MLIGARTGAWSGGAKIPRLRFTNSAWVDIGIRAERTDTVIIKAEYDTSYLGFLFCQRIGTNDSFSLCFISTANPKYYRFDRWVQAQIANSDTSKCDFRGGNGRLTLNGYTMTGQLGSETDRHPKMIIGAGRLGNGSTSAYAENMSVQAFSIVDVDGNLRINLKPATKDGEGCFYDTVGDRYLFASAGKLVYETVTDDIFGAA